MRNSLIRYNPMPALVVDKADGHIIVANKKATKLTGWNNHQLFGKKLSDIFDLPSYESGDYTSTLQTTNNERLSVQVSIQEVSKIDKKYLIVSFWEISFVSQPKSFLIESENKLTEKIQEIEMINNSIPNIRWKADVDVNGNFSNTHISDSVDEFLALPRGTICNSFEKYFSFVKPQYFSDVIAKINIGIANPGEVISFDYELNKANGETIWVSSKGRAFVNTNTVRIFGFTHDITERKKTEQKLLESQKKLELFFSQSVTGFFFMMLDKPVIWNDRVDKEEKLDYIFEHLQITKINDALLRQYKATVEQMIGLTPNELFKDRIPEYRAIWKTFLNDGKILIPRSELLMVPLLILKAIILAFMMKKGL